MSKQVNPNIGMIACPMCGAMCAVRRNRSGKLYFDCLEHGRMTPNTEGGQSWVLEYAEIWGDRPAPDCAPIWIAEQWSWSKAVRNVKQANAPFNEGAPVNVNGDNSDLPPPPPVPELVPEPAVEIDPLLTADNANSEKSGFSFMEGF